MLAELFATLTTPAFLPVHLLTLATALYVTWSMHSRARLPPSPGIRLPFLGHMYLFRQDMRQPCREWRKRLGDVFSLHLGPHLIVILNGYDVIKEALAKRGQDFSDRPDIFWDNVINEPHRGISASSGESWKEHRTLAINILRSFGMGKNIMAEKIQEEITHFIAFLSTFQGEPRDIRFLMNKSVSNVTCSMLVGERFDYEDARFTEIIEIVNYQMNHGAKTGPALVTLYPWLYHIPGDLFNIGPILANRTRFRELFVWHFRRLRSQEVRDNNLSNENFVAAYVEEMDRKAKAGEPSSLSETDLDKCLEDLFFGGTETTSTTLNFCLMYLLNHPEIQAKIHKELDSVVGRERAPAMQDKTNLPYLNAVIMETQRYANILPLGLNRCLFHDIDFHGYRIPKGAQIMYNMDSVFFDPSLWGEDVNAFRPERFLDAEGKLIHREELIPFSVGRRACPGESLAKMELFLFLSALLQKFEFQPSKSGCPPPITDVSNGLTKAPGPYQIKAVARV